MKNIRGLQQTLVAAVTAARDRAAERLISGSVPVDEYRAAVGRIQGHRDALDAITEVFRKLNDEGDDT